MLGFLFDYWPLISGIVGILGVGGILLLLGFWPVVSSFLIGTKLGRRIVIVGAVILAFLWAYTAGKSKGRLGEVGRQKARNYKAVQKRKKINAEVRKMSPAARRNELRKWVRG